MLLKIITNIKKIWVILSQEGLAFLIIKILNKLKNYSRKNSSYLAITQEYMQLEKPQAISLPISDNPLVSIVIPVHNKYLYTYNCLKSLRDKLEASINVEIIIIDDASTDETSQILKEIPGVKIITNSSNLGFIRSCNSALSVAKGEYICLLNNDTQILQGWLKNLLNLIEEDKSVGAVGSKLIYPDGRLQEAGNIIWQDASGWNYGRFDNPAEPEYNYVREVDYCSAASLLVRKTLFEKLGGFSESFLPAYYEDTDICFSIRELGYKILYQPKSALIHYEGISSGTDINSGIKKYQEINRHKFRAKWQNILLHHFYPSELNVNSASRRLLKEKTILIIDSYVPVYDRESGSLRLFEILQIFKSFGYSLIFLPDNGNPEEPYTSILQQLGVEVLYCTDNQPSLLKQLDKRLPLINIAWVCRPEICSKYIEQIRKNPKIKIIYDTVDLHFVRLKRQWELSSPANLRLKQLWQNYENLEKKMAKSVDLTTVVTEIEKEILTQCGVEKVSVIPNVHNPYRGILKSYEERAGLLFIGGYNHTPNIDAVIWLCQEIMPIIWQYEPEIKLTLLGSNPTPEVKALEQERIIVTGFIKDVEPYFLRSRVFVAPLRFGAGMKGKLGQSLSYGLPSVTTNIGSEGMGLTHNFDVLIADNAEEFAQNTLTLYSNYALWNRLSSNSLKTIQQYSTEAIKLKLKNMIDTLIIDDKI